MEAGAPQRCMFGHEVKGTGWNINWRYKEEYSIMTVAKYYARVLQRGCGFSTFGDTQKFIGKALSSLTYLNQLLTGGTR